MRWLKYAGVVVCVLLIIGTLPSVYFIGTGLTGTQVEDPIYFIVKLLIYVAMIFGLGIAAVKLYRSAKSASK